MRKSMFFENRRFIRGVIVLLLVTLINFLSIVDAKALRNLNIGDQYPQFCGEQLGDRKVCSSEFEDNVVIAIFVRLSQPQSREVMLILQDLFANYNGKDVSIVVIVSGEVDLQDLTTFKEKNKLTYPIILDENRQIYGKYGVIAYPSTILAGRDKKIHYLFGSAMTNFKRRLDGATRYLLNEIDKDEFDRIIHPVRKVIDIKEARIRRYYNGAKSYFDRKQFAKAKRLVKISLQQHPEHALSISLYGSVFLQEEKYERALEQFEKALKINPDLEEAKNGKKICLDRGFSK